MPVDTVAIISSLSGSGSRSKRHFAGVVNQLGHPGFYTHGKSSQTCNDTKNIFYVNSDTVELVPQQWVAHTTTTQPFPQGIVAEYALRNGTKWTHSSKNIPCWATSASGTYPSDIVMYRIIGVDQGWTE